MSSSDENSPQHPSRLVLDQVRIAAENIPVKELLELEYNGQVWGPIWRVHLRAHLEAFKQITQQVRVRDIDSEMEWVYVNEHEYFQKRKEEPMPPIPKKEVGNLFYLIHGGQKVGPYTKDQILEKIQSYNLVMTDPISVDMGTTWIKVYQIEEFDRRLKNDKVEGSENLSHLYENLRNNNVVGLKVLQNLSQHDETNPSYSLSDTTIEPAKRKKDGSGDLFEIKWFALFIFAVVGIVAILRGWNTMPSKEKRTPASVKKERMEKVRAKRAQNRRSSNRAPASVKKNEKVNAKNVSRSAASTVKKPNRRRRLNRARTRANKPIGSSAALKSVRKPASNDYYDDGSTPDEQDPVRSQASKETMDPEREYDQDSYDDKQQEEEPYYSPSMKRKPFKRR